ncbi:YDG domain-containing protein, partial [Janthinobacterium sp. MDB2-8]|uniref:YDG domain-containing protein n=1 Tax=Janthinobacterium sp. MDB2-8 TaxID=1259338 RepID=UPI003F266FE0
NAATGKTVTVSGITLGGADAGNYTLASDVAIGTADIGKVTINGVSGISAGNKVYDGKTAASLNLAGATFNGMVAGDTLALDSGTVSGVFSDKNAAVGKTVTINGLGLSGQDAANYVLASNIASTTADITRASLVVSVTAASRVYDTTTGASVTLSDNRIGNDQLAFSTNGAKFSDKNAGMGKTVTVGGIAISGVDAGNYTVNGTASATANIAQAALTVKVGNAEKDQGNANPAFNASYAGLLGGDTAAGELSGNLAFSTTAMTGSAAGDYLVLASGLASTNYALNYVDGVLKVKPTAALQGTIANVIAAVNVVPSQGNMVASETVTGKPDAKGEGKGNQDGAPVVQMAGNVISNVLPGLRLSVVDSGLRLPVESGGNNSLESQ